MRRGEGLRGGGNGGAGAGVGDGEEGEGEAGATAPQTKRLGEAVSADHTAQWGRSFRQCHRLEQASED